MWQAAGYSVSNQESIERFHEKEIGKIYIKFFKTIDITLCYQEWRHFDTEER